MRKISITMIVFCVIIGFMIGYFIYKINSINNIEISVLNSTEVEDECTKISQRYLTNEVIMTNSEEIKITPNTKIILQTKYLKCNHMIEDKIGITDETVSLTKKELQEKYKNYEIKEFSSDKVLLYKELNGTCNEHYVLREENSHITIYMLDENKKEQLVETTKIPTNYLSETDLMEIRQGKSVETKKELNKLLEDYDD